MPSEPPLQLMSVLMFLLKPISTVNISLEKRSLNTLRFVLLPMMFSRTLPLPRLAFRSSRPLLVCSQVINNKCPLHTIPLGRALSRQQASRIQAPILETRIITIITIITDTLSMRLRSSDILTLLGLPPQMSIMSIHWLEMSPILVIRILISRFFDPSIGLSDTLGAKVSLHQPMGRTRRAGVKTTTLPMA